MAGAGESNAQLDYSTRDLSPLQGLSYYRLEQVDNDGSSTFSDAVEVRINKGENDLLVFPDPAQDVVNVVFDPSLGKCEVHLLNDMGQSFAVPITISQGHARIDLSNLTEGFYVVMVITERQVLKKQLVVSR